MAELLASKPPWGDGPDTDSAAARSDAQPAPVSGAVRQGPPAEGGPAGAIRRAATAGPVDVWSRTEPKYRARAIILLVVNLILFSGVCVFTHWLRGARAFDFSPASYAAPLRFWGEPTLSLNDFVLYPVSVEQNPMHGVVLGLLVAAIVAVPISVAILYRFPCALPFVAVVLIFAHLPWMAVTLVGGCILAAVKPFRLSFRFGAALVGMLPVILYLYLATRGTPSQLGTYASPDQKLLLAAPWILAILAACAMLGVTLAISRVVNYRPGAVAPVIAVMFATPALLFHAYVGVDEVSYRVLEASYGPRAERFAVQDMTDKIFALFESRLEEPVRQELLGMFAGRPEPLSALQQRLTRRLLREFLTDRREAYEKCREFIADHPDSRYLANVLYIQGWVLDARLDTRLSFEPGASLQRELYSDYPHVQSEPTWLALLTGHADSPLSLAARLRLAQLRLRRGALDEARQLLAGILAPGARHAVTQSSTQPAGRPWRRAAPESSLGFEPDFCWREAQRLDELIQANRNDPRYGAAPLRELACLDPRRAAYTERLAQLAQRYRDAALHDNLVVLWAASIKDRDERAAQLEACIREFAEGDAVTEAMYRLADLELQTRGEDQEARRQAGLTRMNDLAARYPATFWGRQATERLRGLARPTTTVSP